MKSEHDVMTAGQAGQASAGSGRGGWRPAVGQLPRVVLVGVVAWFLAAMTVRFGTPIGLFSGLGRVVTFAVSIAVAWGAVPVVRAAAGVARGQSFAGMGLATAAAAICDGVAMAWFPALYGPTASEALVGAAWILWGVGWLLVWSYAADGER